MYGYGYQFTDICADLLLPGERRFKQVLWGKGGGQIQINEKSLAEGIFFFFNVADAGSGSSNSRRSEIC